MNSYPEMYREEYFFRYEILIFRTTVGKKVAEMLVLDLKNNNIQITPLSVDVIKSLIKFHDKVWREAKNISVLILLYLDN